MTSDPELAEAQETAEELDDMEEGHPTRRNDSATTGQLTQSSLQPRKLTPPFRPYEKPWR